MRDFKDRLPKQWNQLARSLHLDPAKAEATYAELATAYTAPDRYYHTLAHINEMLDHFTIVGDRATDPIAVQLAIWFHDAVYDSRRSDNERQSAALAAKHLQAWGMPEELNNHVCHMVLSTSHEGMGAADSDTALLLDLDLAILSSPPGRYERYAADIRREYAWVPDANYREGRQKVLRQFLERSRIYTTACWSARETLARLNLQSELDRLGK